MCKENCRIEKECLLVNTYRADGIALSNYMLKLLSLLSFLLLLYHLYCFNYGMYISVPAYVN